MPAFVPTPRPFLIALCAVSALSAWGHEIVAQPVEGRTAEQLAMAEQGCRETATALERKAVTEVHALWTFVTCGDTGAALISERWKRPVTDPEVLHALHWNSRRMHDSRVSHAALEALRNAVNPDPMRVAALEVIAAHLWPDRWIDLGPIGKVVYAPFPGQTAPAFIAERDEYVATGTGRPPMMLTRGKLPVTDQTREVLTASLREFGRATSDRYLRTAIRTLLGPETP